ncbi:Efflux pump ustT, partial [Lachnellula suecica]
IGRKPVFALAMIGMLSAGLFNGIIMSMWKVLPYQLLWVCPLFLFIGGGPAVSSMMFYAVACDITTEANRTNIFLFGYAAGIVGDIISPSIAGGLMAINPWISLILGWFMLALGGSIVAFIPETVHLRLSPSGTLVHAPPAERDTARSRKTNKPSSYVQIVKSQFGDGLNKLHSSITLLNSLPIVLLLVTFLADPFAASTIVVSMRYISKLFNWKLREAAFLLSLRAFIQLILFLVILPLLSKFLIHRLGLSSKRKDLLLAQFSVIMMVLGALLIASGGVIGLTIFGIIVSTLGTGYTSFARSLITTLVDQQHVGRLYAAISIVETLGSLVSGPSINALYSVGLKKGGSWTGLPFYCVAVICSMAAVSVWSFGVLTGQRRRRQEMPLGEEYGDEYADAQTLTGDLVPVEPGHVDEGRIRI